MSMTASEIVESLSAHGRALLPGLLFTARLAPRLGPDDGVQVVFAQVPAGSPEIDALNAKVSFMIAIDGRPWPYGAPAPAKVTAHQFKGRGIQMRAKTGTAEQIAKYIADWLAKNAAQLRGEDGRAQGSADRKRLEGLVWKRTPKDYRNVAGGVKSILVSRGGGSTLVPLSQLTEDEILKRI